MAAVLPARSASYRRATSQGGRDADGQPLAHDELLPPMLSTSFGNPLLQWKESLNKGENAASSVRSTSSRSLNHTRSTSTRSLQKASIMPITDEEEAQTPYRNRLDKSEKKQREEVKKFKGWHCGSVLLRPKVTKGAQRVAESTYIYNVGQGNATVVEILVTLPGKQVGGAERKAVQKVRLAAGHRFCVDRHNIYMVTNPSEIRTAIIYLATLKSA